MTVIFLLIASSLFVSILFLKPKYLYLGAATLMTWLYFYLNHVSFLYFVMFMMGMLLLLVELYIPSFGIVGIMGTVAVGVSLVNAAGSMIEAILLSVFLLLVGFLTAYIYTRQGKDIFLSPNLVLDTAIKNKPVTQAPKDLLGKNGVTLTALRPVGKAKIEDEIYEVLSDIEMIDAQVSIVVRHVEGSKIFVQKEQ